MSLFKTPVRIFNPENTFQTVAQHASGRLMVCLCDVSADDFIIWIGAALCSEHKSVKLQSLKHLNTSIVFQTKDGGEMTLDEAIAAVRSKI